VSGKRRIQARCKNVVKVIRKFIKKELSYNRIKVGRNGEEKGATFPAPHVGNGSKDSKWSSSLHLILWELEEHMCSNDNGSG
jgi:hypothetical protein